MEPSQECPHGKIYTKNGRKRHVFATVSRTRLPAGDKRGDFIVVEKCKLCGQERKYECISA